MGSCFKIVFLRLDTSYSSQKTAVDGLRLDKGNPTGSATLATPLIQWYGGPVLDLSLKKRLLSSSMHPILTQG